MKLENSKLNFKRNCKKKPAKNKITSLDKKLKIIKIIRITLNLLLLLPVKMFTPMI